MNLTQAQIDVQSQNLRKKRLKMELLNRDLQTIDIIDGFVINGSITANANNNIRRSGNITLAIPSNVDADTLLDKLDGFTIESGGKIWIDKYIKISVGIYDISDEHTEWFKLGVFLINKPTRLFSGSEFTISFECIDLMAKLTGQRQGQLTGLNTVIEKGYYETSGANTVYVKTLLSDALASVISELGGFKKYSISQIPDVYKYLPYDIKVSVGSSVYDILKKLLDIIATWQMYFDLDGVLIVEPIPTGENDIVYNLEEIQYISDSLSVDFENVKNQIVVYGRTNILSYYTENSESMINVEYSTNPDGNTATLILKYEAINSDSITINGTTFGFLSPGTPNKLPITNIEIWSGDKKIIYSRDNIVMSLVKFEGSTSSFGKDYGTNRVENGVILPDNIYFVRIFEIDSNGAENGQITNSDGYVDVNQSLVFEFMGKQSVSYCIVNDKKDSDFYINKNLRTENYYGGFAATPTNEQWGSVFDITLNNETALQTLNDGTIITFIAEATNKWKNETATYVNIFNSDGSKIGNAQEIPIVQNIWITTNGVTTRPILQENKISNDYTIWELVYDDRNKWFVFNGRFSDTLTKVLSGGEYDNIYADQLAYERCVWELYNYSNLNDNISLGVVPNYLLDVNNKIKYNKNNPLPKSIKDTVDEDIKYFLTKQITYPLGVSNTPQTITASMIYSDNLI